MLESELKKTLMVYLTMTKAPSGLSIYDNTTFLVRILGVFFIYFISLLFLFYNKMSVLDHNGKLALHKWTGTILLDWIIRIEIKTKTYIFKTYLFHNHCHFETSWHKLITTSDICQFVDIIESPCIVSLYGLGLEGMAHLMYLFFYISW